MSERAIPYCTLQKKEQVLDARSDVRVTLPFHLNLRACCRNVLKLIPSNDGWTFRASMDGVLVWPEG